MTDLLEPVSDLHDEQKLLKYLPHVLKYQDDTFQDRNLPVPDLQKTLDKYLKTLEPILNLAQMKRAIKVVSEMRHDPVLAECQKLLEERADSSPNWLADWWLNEAYLNCRESLVVSVTSAYPFSLPSPFPDVQSWIAFATQLVCGQHMAMEKIQSEEFVDLFRLKNEANNKRRDCGSCILQYYRSFSACRIPSEGADGFVVYPNGAPNGPRHIVVMCRNMLFSVDILDQKRRLLAPGEIFERLLKIYTSCTSIWLDDETDVIPAGLLTCQDRDSWAAQYSKLNADPHNRIIFRTIESSIFVLCLDFEPVVNCEVQNGTTASVDEKRKRISEWGLISLHGGGSKKHSCNRWFDKAIQIVVGMSGYWFVVKEHSSVDGVPGRHFTSMMRHYAETVEFDHTAKRDISKSSDSVKPLIFNFDAILDLQTIIENAVKEVDKVVADLDLEVCFFTSFGKEVIKRLNLSPDAFFQVSLQLAMFRYRQNLLDVEASQQLLVPTYESGSLKSYRWGRTETIRSATNEALQLCRAAAKTDNTDPSLQPLLKSAIRAHSQYTREVMKMEGVDRHLLGLKLAHRELASQDPTLKQPQLFKEQFHDYFSEILLSTSQVPSDDDCFLVFGPISPDCTGVCYNIQSDSITFAVSSFHTSNMTDSKLFMQLVEEMLHFNRKILQQDE
ncbi:carnitine O-acetyltransferase-like [Symsagittifera roscoffensis]|uniref:carnitine O-acetyltransferase-like n=1 Tax=Symsagittifera roscoffensis TaxID=84072 RepID=UPI00307BC6E8